MRILVATPGHLRTAPMGRYAAETLRRMGHEVHLFDSGSLTLPEKIVLRPVARLRGEKRYEKTRLNKRLYDAAHSFRPELFLSMFGFDIFGETVKEIGSLGAHTVCWWMNDPIQNERGLALAKDYEFFFSNCETSVKFYRDAGIKSARFLPHAAFPELHHPVKLDAAEHRHWESEICFVGDWGPIRQGVLSNIAKKFEIRIWGPWHKRLDRKDRLWSRVVDGYFTTEDMARAFSATKIALNLHAWFGYFPYGLNPRVWETPACGALEVCDAKTDLARQFREDEEIITYRHGLELESKLKDLLGDASARERVAKAGMKRVQQEHTYEHRLRELLQSVGTERG